MRNPWIRRLTWTAGTFMGLAGIAVLALHVHTERLLSRPVETPPLAPLPQGDPGEGARLSQVLGCGACHGPDLGGMIFVEIPNVARIVAPNLTEARENYDDPGLQRLLRTGVKADGRLAMVMPNKAFQRLTDQQVADVIAYVRDAPRVEKTMPRTRLTPLARLGVILGEYDVEEMRADPPESQSVLADRNHPDRGRQLAQVVCGECHGLDFQGFPADAVPPLDVVGTYSLEEFTRLMREGLTRSGGETSTGFMSEVARYRFTALTDGEIDAIRSHFDPR
jgi:mono/diheme cytochrome c family protein